jgi:hypothetical protein
MSCKFKKTAPETEHVSYSGKREYPNYKLPSLRIASFAVLLFSLVACAEKHTTAQKAMIELDRAYIPTLLYTSQKNSAKSRDAITELQIAWERFNTHHYRDKQDTAWRSAFENVGGLISRADGLLNTGDNTESAHEALEKIRIIMGALRKHYGLEIFSDYLTDFQTPMEAIVLTVKGVTAESLTGSTLSDLRILSDEARSVWSIIDTLHLDSALYGVTSIELSALRESINEESSRLEALVEALLAHDGPNDKPQDKQAILDCAVAIRAPFVRAYTFFGAFDEAP